MNFKVTIELDEGVSNTVSGGLSSEMVLMHKFKDKCSDSINRLFVREAARAAERCMREITDYFDKHHCTVLQYTNAEGNLDAHVVKSIKDIPKGVLGR